MLRPICAARAENAPGEDIGRARDAGAVTEVSRCPAPHHALVISQRAGSAGGVAETGDRLGTGLSGLAYSYVFNIDQYFSGGQALVISVPGEDVGGRADVGDIVVHSFNPIANYRDSTGDHAGERYGTGAGTVSNGVNSYLV